MVPVQTVLPACRREGIVDVEPMRPVLETDGHVVELLLEADALSQRDPEAAARNLRETVLPRARTNAEAVGRITVTHPRARQLHQELSRLMEERVRTIEAYADALARRDPSALRDVLARQVALDRAMDRIEGEIQAASRTPTTRGCAIR